MPSKLSSLSVGILAVSVNIIQDDWRFVEIIPQERQSNPYEQLINLAVELRQGLVASVV
jgi:hypothetical protein